MEQPASPSNITGTEDEGAETLELEQEFYDARQEAGRIKKEIESSKSRLGRRLKEIAEWEKRYAAMSEPQQQQSQAEFTEAVRWRRQEIDMLQSGLEALKIQAAVAEKSAQGVARDLEPLGISTGPRARPRRELRQSPRQREVRARARVTRLDNRIRDLRSRIEAERVRGKPALAELQGTVARGEEQVNQIAASVEQAKEQIKSRKRELNQWKMWYTNLPGIDKSDAKTTLDREVGWRAREIQTLQTRIGSLEAERLAAMGLAEQARIQIEALQAGAYDRPLEDDPRLAHIRDERKTAETALAILRKHKGTPAAPGNQPVKSQKKSGRMP